MTDKIVEWMPFKEEERNRERQKAQNVTSNKKKDEKNLYNF